MQKPKNHTRTHNKTEPKEERAFDALEGVLGGQSGVDMATSAFAPDGGKSAGNEGAGDGAAGL
jgi:hypothetical protein